MQFLCNSILPLYIYELDVITGFADIFTKVFAAWPDSCTDCFFSGSCHVMAGNIPSNENVITCKSGGSSSDRSSSNRSSRGSCYICNCGWCSSLKQIAALARGVVIMVIAVIVVVVVLE